MDPERCAWELREHGVTVVKTGWKDLWERFHSVRRDFKEFQSWDGIFRVDVLGGFGAYGVPSSFHHPDLRRLRREMKAVAMQIVARMYPDDPDVKLECLFDRMQLQGLTFGVPVAARPHRELRKNKIDRVRVHRHRSIPREDLVLGGWLNCNSPTQMQRVQEFRVYYGTHLDKIDEEQSVDVDRENVVVLPVFPGDWVIFDQRVAREIKPVLTANPHARINASFRVTREEKPMYPVDDIIDKQDVPFLPTGFRAPMLSWLHLIREDSRAKIEQFTKTLKPEFRHPPVDENDFDMPCSSRVTLALLSLQHYQSKFVGGERIVFEPYSDEDRACMHPQLVHPDAFMKKYVDLLVGAVADTVGDEMDCMQIDHSEQEADHSEQEPVQDV